LSFEDDNELLANGSDSRTLLIDVPDDTAYGQQLTVTTTLGVVNPSSKDNKQTLTLETQGSKTLHFRLTAGTDAGLGEVRVTGAGGLADTQPFSVSALDGEVLLTGPTS